MDGSAGTHLPANEDPDRVCGEEHRREVPRRCAEGARVADDQVNPRADAVVHTWWAEHTWWWCGATVWSIQMQKLMQTLQQLHGGSVGQGLGSRVRVDAAIFSRRFERLMISYALLLHPESKDASLFLHASKSMLYLIHVGHVN